MNLLEIDYQGLRKIISGGQDGADRGGIDAAAAFGVETGGTAPKGWRILKGSDPSLAELGLVEHSSSAYPPRTLQNVKDGDATLICSTSMSSPGTVLTMRYCRQQERPFICVQLPWASLAHEVDRVVAFIIEHAVGVLNVAGNAERPHLGPTYHHDTTMELVLAVLTRLQHQNLLTRTP